MPKRITIDSSVFISGFIPTDSNFSKSREFIQKIIEKENQILIPLTSLMEIIHAYFRATKDLEKTDQIYKKFIEWNLTRQIRFLNLEAEDLIYFTAHHHRFPLKTADTLVALTAHRLKCPLITWDKQLLKAMPKVEVMTPTEFLSSPYFSIK